MTITFKDPWRSEAELRAPKHPPVEPTEYQRGWEAARQAIWFQIAAHLNSLDYRDKYEFTRVPNDEGEAIQIGYIQALEKACTLCSGANPPRVQPNAEEPF